MLFLSTPQGPLRNRVQGPMSISYKYFFLIYAHNFFYIFDFVNQIVCVDVKSTWFAHSVLHLAVITSDILKCSTSERIRPAGHCDIDYKSFYIRIRPSAIAVNISYGPSRFQRQRVQFC